MLDSFNWIVEEVTVMKRSHMQRLIRLVVLAVPVAIFALSFAGRGNGG
jgi:hypothetical protein